MNDMKAQFDRFQSRLNKLTDELLRYDIRLIFIALMEQLDEIKNLQENFNTLDELIDRNILHAGAGKSALDSALERKNRTLH